MDKLYKSKLNEKQRMVNFVYNFMVQTLSNFVLQKTSYFISLYRYLGFCVMQHKIVQMN